MALNTTEEIIEDIRLGRMVILMDDEDRENEGDIVVAASCVTPEIVNFMATHARGLICLTLSKERCQYLNLPLMVHSNNAQFSTNFTVSIEAAQDVTTGISAADRALTIKRAVAADSKPEDIVQPGHVFPLMAKPGGVLSRAGHTEAGCDLARLAGFEPSAAIVEIMNEDGTMARKPDLEKFAKKHDLKIGTIADLIHYRITNETTINRLSDTPVETQYGQFNMVRYSDNILGESHMALTLGNWEAGEAIPVRVHVWDPVKDLLSDMTKGDHWTIPEALSVIAKEGKGVVVLLETSEINQAFSNRLDELLTPQTKQASNQSYATIGTGSQILRDLNVSKMRLLSQPLKFTALSGFDLEVVDYIEK